MSRRPISVLIVDDSAVVRQVLSARLSGCPDIDEVRVAADPIFAMSATGVRQINTAMNQIAKVTQQTASSSEELAATAEEMSAQTGQLRSVMSFFTIRDQDRRSRSSASMGHASRPAAAPSRPAGRGRAAGGAAGAGRPGGNGQVAVMNRPFVEVDDGSDFDESKFDRF